VQLIGLAFAEAGFLFCRHLDQGGRKRLIWAFETKHAAGFVSVILGGRLGCGLFALDLAGAVPQRQETVGPVDESAMDLRGLER
jgi:hypothetical protein